MYRQWQTRHAVADYNRKTREYDYTRIKMFEINPARFKAHLKK